MLRKNIIQNNSLLRFSSNSLFILNNHSTDSSLINEKNHAEQTGGKNTIAFENAMPYEQIPALSGLKLLRYVLPGGKWYKQPRSKINKMMFEEFGSFFRVPGVFGRASVLLTTDPQNFETVLRNEGIWPYRVQLDTVTHYRKEKSTSDIYKNCAGLLVEQEKEWAHARSIVNPILMQPRSVKLYIPKMGQVVDDFIIRIKNIRDNDTKEVPKTFISDINNWTLESICVVALDTRLGLINDAEKNPDAKLIIDSISKFFQYVEELDIKPSLWKLIRTPNYYKLMKALDILTNLSTKYINAALERYEKQSLENDIRSENDKGVLERLLKIDKNIAIVMAMDMLMAGIDTTSSAFVSCLLALAKNPEKQNLLREEIMKALPEKNSPLTVENMQNLPYLRACIKEALRMYPVAPGVARRVKQDIVLSGYKVPNGSDVALMFMHLFDDENYFKNPKQFIPERWLRNKINNNTNECPNSFKSSNPFVYLPFGFGPRMCVGKRLVDIELESGIAKIIRNYNVEYNYSAENVFTLNLINVPTGDLNFKFTDIV